MHAPKSGTRTCGDLAVEAVSTAIPRESKDKKRRFR